MFYSSGYLIINLHLDIASFVAVTSPFSVLCLQTTAFIFGISKVPKLSDYIKKNADVTFTGDMGSHLSISLWQSKFSCLHLIIWRLHV